MNEKVSISDINIPNNFKDIKTNYRITLHDKDTGEIVYSSDGHNKLNPNIGLRPWTYTYGALLLSACTVSPYETSSYELPTGLYFFNSQDDPSTNHPAGPQRGTYIGAGKVNVSDSSEKRCSYNPNESKYELIFEDGVPYIHKHMVFDATTSQLNGEINTVVLGANRYMDTRGVYEANMQFRNIGNYSSTLYEYNRPIHGFNASLMSYHPDRPTWLISQGYDSYVYGSWSFESDNTGWFCPYRDSNISSTEDIMLFHYDLKAWKVLDVIKLSLPQECIGKRLVTYKFNDCIMSYTYATGSYAEYSDGRVQYNSNSIYKFNMNGDFVQSVNRSLPLMNQNRFLAFDGKLYHWTGASGTTTYRQFIVFDSELNLLDGFKVADYLDDSRYGTHPTGGKYIHYIAPTFILDNITGDHILTFNGHSASSSSYYGDNNLSWNITKGRVEWLPSNSIYKFLYDRGVVGSSTRITCILDGMPHILPTAGTAAAYWPFIWYNWCKLPSPVTKTANTTMKIQIDLYYPIVNPFAFAALPETKASSTES